MINVESRVCPLCGGDNKCMHNKECWCMDKEIPGELIEKIPLDKREKACICENCIDRFNQEKR